METFDTGDNGWPTGRSRRYLKSIGDMNDPPTAENAADYMVMIDRDTGWPNTAVIMIEHRSGFPRSQFFVRMGVSWSVNFCGGGTRPWVKTEDRVDIFCSENQSCLSGPGRLSSLCGAFSMAW